jgi:ribosomal protein L21E
MKTTKKQTTKVGKVMSEYKAGGLHSGKGGPVVKSRKQAVAIALSQAGMAKKKKK